MGQDGYLKKVYRARTQLTRALSVVSLALAKGKIDEAKANVQLAGEIKSILRRHPFKFAYPAYVSLMNDVVKKHPVVKVKDGDKTIDVRLLVEPLIAVFESTVVTPKDVR